MFKNWLKFYFYGTLLINTSPDLLYENVKQKIFFNKMKAYGPPHDIQGLNICDLRKTPMRPKLFEIFH